MSTTPMTGPGATRTGAETRHLKCPHCGRVGEARVVDCRATRDGRQKRRRRECSGCVGRYSTVERLVGVPEPTLDPMAEVEFLSKKLATAVRRMREERSRRALASSGLEGVRQT